MKQKYDIFSVCGKNKCCLNEGRIKDEFYLMKFVFSSSTIGKFYMVALYLNLCSRYIEFRFVSSIFFYERSLETFHGRFCFEFWHNKKKNNKGITYERTMVFRSGILHWFYFMSASNNNYVSIWMSLIYFNHIWNFIWNFYKYILNEWNVVITSYIPNIIICNLKFWIFEWVYIFFNLEITFISKINK